MSFASVTRFCTVVINPFLRLLCSYRIDDLTVRQGEDTALSAHFELKARLGSLVDWDLGCYSLSYGVSGAEGGFTIESDTVLAWPERILNSVESLADADLVEAAEATLLTHRARPVRAQSDLGVRPALSLDGNAGIKTITRFRAGSLPAYWESFTVDIQAVFDGLGETVLERVVSLAGLRRVIGVDPVPLIVQVKSAAGGFMTSGDLDGTAWGLSYHVPSPESIVK